MKLLPFLLIVGFYTGGLPATESWPQFRGPGGAATAPEGAKIPVEWSESRNLKWKTSQQEGGRKIAVVRGKCLNGHSEG